QRQNLGRARVPGLELAFDWRIVAPLTASAAYTFVDPRVVDAPGRPELLGKLLAQDPAHRATVGLALASKQLANVLLQLRWLGPQFEDDLNTLPMAGVALVDVYAGRELRRGVEVFGAIENLFDRTWLVGRAGVDTVGQPFTARLGVKLSN
ncbi:MAG: TonB-dependent receptor domain-containing protein, partial [Myxococcales bacterium]